MSSLHSHGTSGLCVFLFRIAFLDLRIHDSLVITNFFSENISQTALIHLGAVEPFSQCLCTLRITAVLVRFRAQVPYCVWEFSRFLEYVCGMILP